jgi:hypothetical protein
MKVYVFTAYYSNMQQLTFKEWFLQLLLQESINSKGDGKMQKRYLLILVVVFLSIVLVESSSSLPIIDFRVRSAGSKWEAAIYSSGTGDTYYDIVNPWPDTLFYYSVSWNAYTGTAKFIAKYPDESNHLEVLNSNGSNGSELFRLERTFSSLIEYKPKIVALLGKDSDAGASLMMSVDGGGPSFDTGITGWLSSQNIPVSNPANFTLTGTFQFTGDDWGSQDNLRGQIQLKNFTSVPEPSTLLLLGSGLLGLWGLRKKFKKQITPPSPTEGTPPLTP